MAHLYAETFDDIYREGSKGWLKYFEDKVMPPRPDGTLQSSAHTIGRHVGKTIEDLRGRFDNPAFTGNLATTFNDLDTAEEALSFFATAERAKILARASDAAAGEKFSKVLDMGRPLGFGVDRAGSPIRGLRRINVSIIFDGRGGWFVHTAYPTP